ncbi:uncharacterized protein LOC111321787 [Stylophora pistillata]|uniref:uncharacterized protein LOC111321787 n=1 Tax=Stylophora pistillata TaxID=50429 RepID=UPI000C03C82B|nr:uncharacterized protein LOC111321787 [Stylophora pistillata]
MVKLINFDTHVNEKPKRRLNDFLDEDYRMLSWVDKGSEYYNKDVKDLMKSHGIKLYSTENEEKSSIVERYNNTKRGSIGTTPVEASKKKNESAVYLKLYGESEPRMATPKFQVGDQDRIYKRKVFDKGYTPNCTEEIFVVNKIQYTNPITYKLKDFGGEEIEGSFYEKEMLKATQDIFRVDKVIPRNGKTGKALVKWNGYPEKFNSWIDLKDLENLN